MLIHQNMSFLILSIILFIYYQALWLGLKAFLAALECRSGSYTNTIRFLKSEIHTVEMKLSCLKSELRSAT